MFVISITCLTAQTLKTYDALYSDHITHASHTFQYFTSTSWSPDSKLMTAHSLTLLI